MEFISIAVLDNMAHQLSKELSLLPGNAFLLEDNMVIRWAFLTSEEDSHQGISLKRLLMPWKLLKQILWVTKFLLNQEDTSVLTHFIY